MRSFLEQRPLLSTFKLSTKNTEIDINSVSAEVVKVDYDEKRKDAVISKFSVQSKNNFYQINSHSIA